MVTFRGWSGFWRDFDHSSSKDQSQWALIIKQTTITLAKVCALQVLFIKRIVEFQFLYLNMELHVYFDLLAW